MGERPVGRGEYIADAAVHAVGLGFVAVAVPALLFGAHRAGDGPTLAALAVYGASLLAMVLFSALYNLGQRAQWATPRRLDALRRLDHGAIFLKIAGTYTPFAALSMAAGSGLRLLVAVWAVAVIGALVKIAAPRRFEFASVALYLALGWAVIWVGAEAVASVSPPALALLAAGGVLYTMGVAFHLWDRLPFQNAIWHLHVLVASVCMYGAVVLETLG